jgi:hypothetical protein
MTGLEGFEWKTPPQPAPRHVDRVAAALRANPGEWARIAHCEGIQLFTWWAPLSNSPDFETKYVPVNPDRPLGAREVYARFKPTSGAG